MPTWPAYENTVRVWGDVETIFDTTEQGNRVVVAVVLAVPDNIHGPVKVRIEGGTAAMALGMGEFVQGDSMLVSGHLAARMSCHHDGVDNMIIPNCFWKKVNGQPVQVTQ